jgi:hypothetical protein
LSKRVLLITYHFPPSAASGSFRLLGFARHLPRAGWQPLVVAPPETPWEPVDPQLSRQVPAEVVHLPVLYPSAAPKVVRYFAPYAVWLAPAWSACKRMIHDYSPDVILTSSPPHCVHMLGQFLKRSTGLPWVADFRDPWISDGRQRSLSLRERWDLSCERNVFQKADLILANAPNACRMLQETYPQHRQKIVSLTNGFDPRPGPKPPRTPSPDGSVRLMHAGELYAGRDPVPLFEALAQANVQAGTTPSFELHVVGRIDPTERNFAEMLKERGWDRFVYLKGQLAYQDALNAMEQADILVLFDSPGRTIGVPAKLYEYLGAERPILALAERNGDVAEVLRQSGMLHRIASPTNAADIQRAVEELRHEMQTTAPVSDAALLQQFTREYLATALAGMLDTLTGQQAVR